MKRSKGHSKRLFNRKVQELSAKYDYLPWCPSMAEIRAFKRSVIHGWYARHRRIQEYSEYIRENLQWED